MINIILRGGNCAGLAGCLFGIVLVTASGSLGQSAQTRPASEATVGRGDGQAWTLIPIDDERVFLAPYVWKCTGQGRAARAEAGIPGAYLKVMVRGTTAVRLLIDGAANNDCPPTSMPIVDFSVDHGAFKSVTLTKTGEVYALPVAEGLDAGREHRLEVYLRATHLGPDRWRKTMVHLRLAGLEVTAGGSASRPVLRPKRAIGFGDSITEGVCAEGQCPYYSNLMMNNARVTWFPLVCAALGAEYGQVGTGGQGMARVMEYPPLPQTWDRYDPETSRLVEGKLRPEPDYVFCMMGTNDHARNGDKITLPPIRAEYEQWVIAVRKACPQALIFCVVPPLGWHAEEIAEMVAARNQAGDRRVFLIETAALQDGYGVDRAMEFAPDGAHPSVYGNAMLGALIAVEAQKCIDGEGK